MNKLISGIAFGIGLCLVGCSGSHLSQVGQVQSMKVVTVDSLGIKLGDSWSKIEGILKSRNILYTQEVDASSIKFTQNSPDTDMGVLCVLETNIGKVQVIFIFDKNQKLVMYTAEYSVDCSMELSRLEERKGFLVLTFGMEQEDAELGKIVVEKACMSADGKIISYICQMHGIAMYICMTPERAILLANDPEN